MANLKIVNSMIKISWIVSVVLFIASGMYGIAIVFLFLSVLLLCQLYDVREHLIKASADEDRPE